MIEKSYLYQKTAIAHRLRASAMIPDRYVAMGQAELSIHHDEAVRAMVFSMTKQIHSLQGEQHTIRETTVPVYKDILHLFPATALDCAKQWLRRRLGKLKLPGWLDDLLFVNYIELNVPTIVGERKIATEVHVHKNLCPHLQRDAETVHFHFLAADNDLEQFYHLVTANLAYVEDFVKDCKDDTMFMHFLEHNSLAQSHYRLASMVSLLAGGAACGGLTAR